jgi:hypothetical protein
LYLEYRFTDSVVYDAQFGVVKTDELGIDFDLVFLGGEMLPLRQSAVTCNRSNSRLREPLTNNPRPIYGAINMAKDTKNTEENVGNNSRKKNIPAQPPATPLKKGNGLPAEVKPVDE